MTALEWIRGGWKSSPYCRTDDLGRVGIDFDTVWGFQCKDFSNAYANFLGHDFTAGHAITLWTDPQDPYWKKVSNPQPGDVYVKDVVLDGVNYGDTGIVDEVTSTGIYVWAQNQVLDNLTLYKGHPPVRVFYRFNQIKGYLRGDIMDTLKPDQADLVYKIGFNRPPRADEMVWLTKEGGATNALQTIFNNNLMFRTKAENYDKNIAKLQKQIDDLKGATPIETPITDQTGWAWLVSKIKGVFVK